MKIEISNIKWKRVLTSKNVADPLVVRRKRNRLEFVFCNTTNVQSLLTEQYGNVAVYLKCVCVCVYIECECGVECINVFASINDIAHTHTATPLWTQQLMFSGYCPPYQHNRMKFAKSRLFHFKRPF